MSLAPQRSTATPPLRHSQSVSVTRLLAWRAGPHAHTRCTRLAREPARGTVTGRSTGSGLLDTQHTAHRTAHEVALCSGGFSGTHAGEEGAAQGRGHRTHELTSRFACSSPSGPVPRPLHRRSPPSSMSAASLCLQSCSCTPRWVCQPQLATEAALTEQSDTLCSKPRLGVRGGPHPGAAHQRDCGRRRPILLRKNQTRDGPVTVKLHVTSS